MSLRRSCKSDGCKYALPKVLPHSSLVKLQMSKGVRFHMKVLIRGLSGSGKSTLLARLCGYSDVSQCHSEGLDGQASLVVSSLRLVGSGCQADQGTKADLWKLEKELKPMAARSAPAQPHASPQSTAGTSLLSSPPEDAQEALKAVALRDLYRSAEDCVDFHCVIVVIDSTNAASLAYAKALVDRVPRHVHIILVLNKCDVPFESKAKRRKSKHKKEHHKEEEVEGQSVYRQIRTEKMKKLFHLTAESLESYYSASEFMLHTFHSREVPVRFRFPLSYVEVSAKTGEGLQEILYALDIPNRILQLKRMESSVQGYYEALREVALNFQCLPFGVRSMMHCEADNTLSFKGSTRDGAPAEPVPPTSAARPSGRHRRLPSPASSTSSSSADQEMKEVVYRKSHEEVDFSEGEESESLSSDLSVLSKDEGRREAQEASQAGKSAERGSPEAAIESTASTNEKSEKLYTAMLNVAEAEAGGAIPASFFDSDEE